MCCECCCQSNNKKKTYKFKRRKAPAHAALQTEVIKMIAKKHSINYREAIRKLKDTVSKAIGENWDVVKARGKMTWMDALNKTKAMI